MSNRCAGAQSIREALAWLNKGDADKEAKVADDAEPQACGVCGDLARGYHFNALTCEGCKSFFR